MTRTNQIQILSFGGGIDSTALLALALNRDMAPAIINSCRDPHLPKITREDFDAALPELDAVVFSDPGAEYPATYDNIRIARIMTEDQGIRFEVVKKETDTILTWLERNGNLPLLPGGGHVCSLKFKAEPLHKWAEKEYSTAINWLIGIEANEKHRRFTSKTDDIHQCSHPLVTLGLNRIACKAILSKLHWPIDVVKSSCWFCPFNSKEEIRNLHDNHPSLWLRAVEIEERFERTSPAKHKAFIDGGSKVNAGGRALPGTWKKDSWAEGARLFAKSEGGKRKSLAEWAASFEADAEADPLAIPDFLRRTT